MIKSPNSNFRLLIADDDIDDVQLTKSFFTEKKLPIQINEVHDGDILLEHLRADTKNLPQLILLDLNMPKKGGLEALEEIKMDEIFRRIPVVIFSTSNTPDEIEKAYELGASCFVSKPDNVEEWRDKIEKIGKFWVECVKVPS